MQPVVYLTRIETFSACHRLHSNHLSDDENLKVFGKCNNRHGHGHNYQVEVTIKNKVDEVTGMAMNISDLKHYMQEAIMAVLDHRNLDKDVNYFQNKVSTTENLSVFIWESMKNILPREDLLHEICIRETNKNIVRFRGEYA